jgi:hypothetical protein
MSSSDWLYSLDPLDWNLLLLLESSLPFAVPRVSAVISLVVVVHVSYGYLIMRTIVVVVAGSSPLTVVYVSPIIFG